MDELTIGGIRLVPLHRRVALDGESHTRTRNLSGTGELVSVDCGVWQVVIVIEHWSNGDDNVRLYDRGGAPQYVDRLRTKGRMGVLRHPRDQNLRFVELDQAQIGDGDHPVLRKVDRGELEAGAPGGLATLEALGCAAVGTRGEAINDASNRSSRLCAVFPAAAVAVPPAAYVIARVSPLLRGVRAS